MNMRAGIHQALRFCFSKLLGKDRVGTETLMSHVKILRKHKWVTALLGPLFKPNHQLIEIEITTDCNLNCYNCNRSCRQAPSDENMSLAQIEGFIAESKAKGRRWQRIRILGGEPTVHPQVLEIVQALLRYKHEFSPATKLVLVTNGFGVKVQEILSRIPPEIVIENTHKTSAVNMFDTYNMAAIDLPEYKDVDYVNACHACSMFAIALTRYGYYPCGAGASVDRVFGFNIGRKELPSLTDPMADELRRLCRYCGHFKHHIHGINKEYISPSWQEAYRQYKINKPVLDLYGVGVDDK